MYRRALESREKVIGIDHPDSVKILDKLRYIHENEWSRRFGSGTEEDGRFETIESMYRRVLECREKALGVDHPDTLDIVNKLAGLINDENEREALYRRALAGREKTIGPDHPDTLESVEKLGDFLQSQDDLKGAEALYRRALAGREKTIGPDHPNTLRNMYELGQFIENRILNDAEEAETLRKEAETLYRRALAGREKSLGLGHPDTVRSVISLREFLSSQRDAEEREALFRRTLEVQEKILGIEHPFTMYSVYKLGHFITVQGDAEGGEAVFRNALDVREKLLGLEHPATLRSVKNLGDFLGRKKRDHEGRGEGFYRATLERYEIALGTVHPMTLKCMIYLAELLERKRNYEFAESLYRRAMSGIEMTLGGEYQSNEGIADLRVGGGLSQGSGNDERDEGIKDRGWIEERLRRLLIEKGDFEGAEALCHHVLERRIKAFGLEDSRTWRSVDHLVSLYVDTNRRGAAIKLLREWSSHSNEAADNFRYQLACYECLEGNLEEAKRLIQKHLTLHPAEKDRALADDDFAAIRDFIETL